MDYPDENQQKAEKPLLDKTPEPEIIVNDILEEKKGIGLTLWPKGTPTKKTENKALSFLKDWSDLIFLTPVMLILFLTGQYWIRAINPTSAFLDPENLTVLNWNLFLTFLGSGVVFVLFKIWVGGTIFSQEWKDGMTPFQVMIVKLAMVGMLAIYVAYMITRNV